MEDLVAEVTSVAGAAAVVEVISPVARAVAVEVTSLEVGDSAVVYWDFILLDHDSAVSVAA
jgi:hypothetical protein